jgi:PKD repeat protein
MRKIFSIFLLVILSQLAFSQQPTTDLKATSANPFVVSQFDWAIGKALDLVVVGDVVPGYAAAMDLSQFCARDVAHMAEGAHILGLQTENYSMLHAFVYGANRRVTTDFYWPRWHHKFDGTDLNDFGSCQWRCLPTTFDVMQSSYRQYLWTGNNDYINDVEFETYYSNTHDYTKFMEHQDSDNNGVADEVVQLATYWEQSPDNFIEAGDAITYQYMALDDYSKILAAKGDAAGAATFAQKAADLKAHFETNWFSVQDNMYVRGFDAAGNSKTDWGRESTFLMPYSEISDQGERTERYLDFITQNIYTFGINIEATTYLAEIYYLHGRTSTGWHFLKRLMASENGYPEVSYLVINNTVRGMMGFSPDAPNNSFSSLSKLSYEVPWIEVEHIPLGTNDLKLRHDGLTKSTCTNTSGVAMTWEAQFYGAYNTVTVNGVAAATNTKLVWGKTVTYVTTPINVGETIIIEASDPVDIGYIYLSDMTWTNNTNEANTKRDFNTEGNLLFMDAKYSYEKGIGMMSNTEITYDISGQGFKSFITDIGIDDEVEDQGSVVFEIWVDGVIAYTSGTMQGSTATKSMAINVENANTLKIVVTDAGDGTGHDYADWGNARLSKSLVPVLALEYESLSGGDGNGIFDPGETMDVHLKAQNTGSAATGALTSTCVAMGPNANMVTVNNPTVNINALTPNTINQYTHGISVDANAVIGAQFQLRFVITDGITTVQLDKSFFITDMYLSDANYTYARFDNGSLVRDKSFTNGPITINGVVYPKGLGVHANCEIKYDIGGAFKTFIADVGVRDNASSGSITFEVWTDGVQQFVTGVLTDNSATVSIAVDVTGVQELELRVTDGGDGINSDHANWGIAKVSSRDAVVASFVGNPTTLLPGNQVSFTDQSLGNPTSYTWTFEGGTPPTSNDQNPVVTYNSTGDFDVTLLVGDGNTTDTKVMTNYIEVSNGALPTAAFTADDTNIQVGGSVHYTDQSTNTTTWNWAFEGGTPATSTAQNPTVVYNSVGTYDVTLVAGDGTNTDNLTKTDYIDVNNNVVPNAAFTADDTSISTGGTVNYTNQSTNANAWTWTFEGGTPANSNDENPSVVYNTAGTYDVTLVASDGANNDNLTKTDYIQVNVAGVGDLAVTFDHLNGGNGNANFDPGETLDVIMNVENNGNAASAAITSTCTAVGANNNFVTINDVLVNIPALAANANANFTHSVSVAANAPIGELFTLNFVITDGAQTTSFNKEFFITDLYLSDTNYTFVQIGWGSVQLDQSIGNNPITLNGVTYTKGLGVHAECELRYDLGGNFLRFKSDVGIDDEVNGSPATVAFEVWADGVQLYNGAVMNSASPTQSIDVDITGKNELILIVTDGGDGINSDHADWADAILSTAGGAVVSLFTADNTSIVAGQTVNYTDQSTGAVNSWTWTFEGGTPASSNAQNPSVVYNAAGNFDATLLVGDGNTTDQLVKADYITVTTVTADFTADNTTVVAGGTVNYTDQSTNATSWSWTFPGGTPAISNDQNPSVVYATAGTYDAVLEAGDGMNTDVMTKTDYVTVTTVTAEFTADITLIEAGRTVNYSDQSTNATSWSWTFPGGTPAASTLQNPSVVYAIDGVFDVTLEAGDGMNTDVMTKTDYITVTVPTAAFTADATVITEGETVNYIDQSINATSWSWTFPGGTPATSTNQNPSVVYNTTGVYDVTLEVSDDNNNTSQLTQHDYINVNNGVPAVPLSSSGILIAGLLMAVVVLVRKGKLF